MNREAMTADSVTDLLASIHDMRRDYAEQMAARQTVAAKATLAAIQSAAAMVLELQRQARRESRLRAELRDMVQA